MFVQNQIKDLDNHQKVIMDTLSEASEARFVVAYVKENGVDMILDGLKNKPAKLLCSLDMGITQISGIQKLLENQVEVRVYKSSDGTFHPKTWLFKCNNKWRALVGSANLTRAAMVDNVEASVLLDDENITATSVIFFNYLWSAENSNKMTLEYVKQLQKELMQRRKIKTGGEQPPAIDPGEEHKHEILFSFIKSWIDISKWERKGTSSVWRGWYIIPDHGCVSDDLVRKLASYLPIIGDGIALEENYPSEQYKSLLNKFQTNSNFKRPVLKSSLHKLFVRQAKNYLIKFGWAYHPLIKKGDKYKLDKTNLCPTDLGRRIACCQDIKEVRRLYSEYFEDRTYNGLLIVRFVRRLLERFGTLNLREFDYFVTHAYSDDDMDVISEMIIVYRSCHNPDRLEQQVANYFKKIKEPTAKNVRSNYIKKLKHAMSIIGWCQGFSLSKDFVIRLSDDAS